MPTRFQSGVMLLDREIDISNYIPNILKEFREFKALAASENPELLSLWGVLENVMNDQFVNDSTENGVKRWESILKIVPKGTDSLDIRKFRISTRLNEQLPYTYTTLEQQLVTLCGDNGFSMELQNEIYTLIIKVNLTAKGKFNEVDSLMQRMVPANIVIDLSLLYNQHLTLANFTHSQLAAYTHNQLRNEVIS